MSIPTVTIPLPLWQWRRLDELTSREREICRLVACGLESKEIARRIGTSERTVRTQLQVIFEKTGMRTRTSVGMMALLAGIVDVDMILDTWRELAPEAEGHNG